MDLRVGLLTLKLLGKIPSSAVNFLARKHHPGIEDHV